MKAISTEILNLDFSIEQSKKNLPSNIYALKVLNVDENEVFEIAINHNGYCPELNSEREESIFTEYLCNLEYNLIEEYFKYNKIKKPKSYYSLCEVMTDNKGELYRFSKTPTNEIIRRN